MKEHIPPWLFLTILGFIFTLLGVVLSRIHRSGLSDLRVEDFLTSTDDKGKRIANPHKLVFLACFIITAWVEIMIAPSIPSSETALYYSIFFTSIFTISLLSKTVLSTVRDIIAIIWGRKD